MPTNCQTPSFQQIYSSYSPSIRAIIRGYVKDSYISKDIYQEVVLKIWLNMPNYDKKKSGLYAWIVVIARNTCLDHLRRAKVRAHFLEQKKQEGVDFGATDQHSLMARAELSKFSQQLPGPQQEIIRLIYFKGHTQQETATLLNMPLGTIKTRQKAAIRTLRKFYIHS